MSGAMEGKLLAKLLGYALRGESATQVTVEPDHWEKLIKLAKRHKVANTLACVLPLLGEENRPNEELAQKLETVLFEQTMIGSNQLFAAQELQQAFEEKELYSLCLKGIHTKLRYPQDNMRSMGDLDILCKAEQNTLVKRAMADLGYGGFQEGRKHDHYSRPPYIAVEMHRQLVSVRSDFDAYCQSVWERSKPLPGCRFAHAMTVEDEYAYNLIHMVEHFKEGGVGLRFVMDIYVYETQVEMDRAKVAQELEKLSLTEFHRNVVKLARHLFEEGETDSLTEELAAFIFSGGVYGSRDNAQALSVSKNGRIGFVLRTCFPGYRDMCTMFPWLAKCPVLLPLTWLIRAVRSLFFRRRNVKGQLNAAAKGDKALGRELRQFYRKCGLDM